MPVRSTGIVTGVVPIGFVASPTKMSAPAGTDLTATLKRRDDVLASLNGGADLGRISAPTTMSARRAAPPTTAHLDVRPARSLEKVPAISDAVRESVVGWGIAGFAGGGGDARSAGPLTSVGAT